MGITWVSRRMEQVVGGLRKIRVVDTRIEHFTPALCDILGYSPETLKGAWLSEIEHPDDRWQGKVNAYLRHIKQPAPKQYVVRWQDNDGAWVYLRKCVQPTACEDAWLVKAEVIREGDFKAPKRQTLDAMGIDVQGWTAYNGRFDFRLCVDALLNHASVKGHDVSGIPSAVGSPDLDTFTDYMILSSVASQKGLLYRSQTTGRTRRQYVCHRCGWGWMSQAGRESQPTQCPECNSVIWWKTDTE